MRGVLGVVVVLLAVLAALAPIDARLVEQLVLDRCLPGHSADPDARLESGAVRVARCLRDRGALRRDRRAGPKRPAGSTEERVEADPRSPGATGDGSALIYLVFLAVWGLNYRRRADGRSPGARPRRIAAGDSGARPHVRAATECIAFSGPRRRMANIAVAGTPNARRVRVGARSTVRCRPRRTRATEVVTASDRISVGPAWTA